MSKFLFTAKSRMPEEDLLFYEIPNDGGWVTGWYVDGHIVGPVEDSAEDYFSPHWWCPVEEDTIIRAEMIDRGLNIKDGELGRRGWFNKTVTGEVVFTDDPKGMWYVDQLLSKEEANRKITDRFGKVHAGNEMYGAAGLDPIDAGRTTPSTSRSSTGCSTTG